MIFKYPSSSMQKCRVNETRHKVNTKKRLRLSGGELSIFLTSSRNSIREFFSKSCVLSRGNFRLN